MLLLDFYSPPVCPVCENELPYRETRVVCSHCWNGLTSVRLSRKDRCPRCYTFLDGASRCEFCETRRVYFDSHISLYRFTPEWHRVLLAWKFQNERRLFRLFAEGLVETLKKQSIPGPVHFVYIKSGKSGRDLRSYQPCKDLCRLATAQLPEASMAGSVGKRKKRKQSSSSFPDRFFAVHDSLISVEIPYGRPVILIEDLFTTGATANEAARLLKKKGAVSVHLISMLFHDKKSGKSGRPDGPIVMKKNIKLIDLLRETGLALSTGNRHKKGEFERMLKPLGIRVLLPSDFGVSIDAEETAPDFAGNALIKARALSEAIGIPSVADDSGLEVDALGGEPGVRSARYGGPGLDDHGRCLHLLANLSGVEAEKRSARFVSVIALVRSADDPNPLVARGEAPGKILEDFRGDEGFGYDPIFLDEGTGLSFAEMSGKQKDSLSHRGRALETLLQLIDREF